MAQSADGNLQWWEKVWIWLKPIWKSDSETPAEKPSESLSEEFRRDVRDATALLKFLIKEGGPDPIRDQIIDDIEASRDLLGKSDPPSKEARAKLLKAYAELARVPRTSVTSATIPPVTFWSVDSQWPRWLMGISIIPSIIALIVLLILTRYRSEWYWPLIYLFLSSLAVSGLYVFTGLVTANKLNQIIRFCYIFTGFALLVSSLPFTLPNLIPESEAPLGILRGCAKAEDDAQKNWYAQEVLCKGGSPQWVMRIGGTVAQSAPGREITGGLVVPLYVIVLALMGGAISMTRRVPEYQRRALDSHDPLTNAEAREYLVFQIMQVITAPLIAVTAYYIFRPATPVESVLIGFVSGFASEPILVMIRGLVDKLRPATQPPQPAPINVTVIPPSANVSVEKTQQFTAKVLGSANSDVTWVIDPSDGTGGTISQSGFYAAPKSLPTKAVTITARSAADPTKSASASVKVEPAETVPAGQKSGQSSAISVTVSPPSPVTVSVKTTQQFAAKVSGSTNSEVTWSIDPSDGSAGTISKDGLYTAPQTAPTKEVTITAKSVADTTKSGTATVKVVPA
jgi:hypothetical protein